MHALATSWLAHLCGVIPGAAAGVIMICDKDEGDSVAGVWPQESSPPPPLLELARNALADDVASSQAPDHTDEPASNAQVTVAVPIQIRGGLRAAVAVAMSVHIPGGQKRALELVTDGAQWLSWLLAHAPSLSTPASEPEDTSATPPPWMFELIAAAVEAEGFHAAAFAIVTELAANFGCERVSLGFLKRKEIQVCALSHSARFDPRSSLVRTVESAMEEATDIEASVIFPAPEGTHPLPCRAHEKLALEYGAASVHSIPLSNGARVVGALTLEYPQGSTSIAGHLEFCEQTAPLLGAILEEKRLAGRWIGHLLLDSLRDGLEDLFGPRRPALKLLTAAFVLLLLLLTIVPVTHRVSSPAILEGRVQRVIAAPVQGFIAESRARAGDVVRKGEVLASLDDAELRLERQKWSGRRTQLQKEYRAAVAGHDRSEANIVRAQLRQAEAESRLISEQLSRMSLVAPFDGIIARGDLSQSLGSPVERGQVLFEIAPLDDYRIILEIDERDISNVSAGQVGHLSLAALPGRNFELAVQRIIPVATTEEGRNFFRAEAHVDSPPALLRPGMEGVAKVEVGRRSLLWIWTHRMIDWLRFWLWSKVF